MHFYKLFELKCVLAVCVHNPIMIKIHPVFFLSTKIFTPFSNRAVCLCDFTRTEAPPTNCWLTVVFQHRLHWCLTSDPPWVICHQLFHHRSRCRQEWLLIDCFVVGCNNEHSSSYLLLSSERWRGLRNLDLPKCVYVHTNHSWSSFIYRRSENKVFLINFANRLS